MLVSLPASALAAQPPAAEQEEPKFFPLDPPDTSSPRATLTTFLDNVHEAVRIYRAEGLTRKSQPRLDSAVARAVGCLDLSAVPPTKASSAGSLAAALIKEVLDRVERPPLESVPDAEGMKALEEAGALPRWRVPHTQITIARIADGPRQGEYLFTAGTVARVKQYYEQVKDLPYQVGATPGLYELALYAPGIWIPEQWVLALPTWMRVGVLEVAVWQWLGMLLLLAVAALLLWPVYRWTRARKQRAPRARHWVKLLFDISVIVAAAALHYLIQQQLGIGGIVFDVVGWFLWVIFFTAAGFGVFAIGNGVAEGIIASPRIARESIDAHLVRISIRLVSFLLVFYLVVVGAQYLGIPLAPLLAGIGVGGLAVALAARPTLENLIGGLTLFADRPVRVGDFCRYGDAIGHVEEIGLRSTRIRSLDRTVVSVPNSTFSELKLENFAKRDRIRLHTTVQLRYETTAEQLRYVMAKLYELLVAHPKIRNDPPLRVRLIGFGEHSIDVEIFCYGATADWDEFLAVREDIFLRIMDIVKDAGTGFAVPARATYLSRDKVLDADQARGAEAQVETWRAEGTLPFPAAPEQRREALQDTLDYPPAGSPDGPPATPETATTGKRRTDGSGTKTRGARHGTDPERE
ncbi:MAG: mechanosensitive ion channel family protein [Acidiferrobacterales bacterium]